ncbi:MAG: DUF1501 domain-containing protein [Candidatus Hydrogenedentes bacterium]|nr:DUF1501 domain-containing protein [Candidatus Hydrogenedentota bacterium]
MNIIISRRGFLKGAAMFSSIGLAPAFLAHTAETVSGGATPIAGFKDGRILVVVQLGGGNDGLNTLVPWSNDAYYRARPALGLKKDRVIRITDDLAANDKLADLMKLYDNGQVAIVQGVGYPNPDRSHFRSMEIWHTASDSDEYLSRGWIGRYFDNCCSGSARPQAGVSLGKERPQAFDGEKGIGVAFEDPMNFGWRPGKTTDTAERFEKINADRATKNDTLDFLRHTTSNAIMSSYEVKEAAQRAGAGAAQPKRPGQKDPLQTVAALIRGDLQTRIYYVSTSGFDTHASQAGTHDQLLERYAQAMAKFQQTLEADGNADRVVTLVFSEFGRRVEQNASGGTDHGTAAPMFVIGKGVKPGLYGAAPSLTDLDDGDLKFNVDFRGVYASLLEGWFGVAPEKVLGKEFKRVPVIA